MDQDFWINLDEVDNLDPNCSGDIMKIGAQKMSESVQRTSDGWRIAVHSEIYGVISYRMRDIFENRMIPTQSTNQYLGCKTLFEVLLGVFFHTWTKTNRAPPGHPQRDVASQRKTGPTPSGADVSDCIPEGQLFLTWTLADMIGGGRLVTPLKMGDFQGLCLFSRWYILYIKLGDINYQPLNKIIWYSMNGEYFCINDFNDWVLLVIMVNFLEFSHPSIDIITRPVHPFRNLVPGNPGVAAPCPAWASSDVREPFRFRARRPVGVMVPQVEQNYHLVN